MPRMLAALVLSAVMLLPALGQAQTYNSSHSNTGNKTDDPGSRTGQAQSGIAGKGGSVPTNSTTKPTGTGQAGAANTATSRSNQQHN